MIEKKLQKEHGFSVSEAMKSLICCVGWYSPRYKHEIRIGEFIYWRTNGRPMGHCEKCAKEIIEQERKQGSLFSNIK